ncbi:MAG: CHAT domain-containing protein, partial [Cyclobacteriaceae bacterium]
ISVSDVQENLLSQHNAVVEYFKGADHLFTFYVDQQQVSLHHQSIDDHFNNQINRFIDAIKTHNSVPQTFAKASSELYDILVAPLQIGNNITHLNIVPDGVLNYVPFEILSSASDLDNYQLANYLFKDYSISYQYSTTISLESLKNQEKVTDGQYLAFAPDFNKRNNTSTLPDQALAFNEPVRGSLAELEGTEREVSVISKLIEGQFYEGSGASELRFKQQAKDFSIIHLATHAIIDNDNPMNSRLLFTINDDTTEDGDLHAWELYNMKLKARMAVLSACNTGSGQLQRGEGVMSLGRAFAYAGCPSIVMSLWPAQDQATADIMTYFYEGLANGSSKDKALQEAKLKYLENAEDLFAHPFYWAGFVVQGDPKPIILSKRFNYWWIIVSGFLIFLFLGATAYFRRK